MRSAAWEPENLRWLDWQSVLLMGGPIYVPAGPDLDNWRIFHRGVPGRPASGVTAKVNPLGPRQLWVTTWVDEVFVHPGRHVGHLLGLSVPEGMTLPYRATVDAREVAMPLGSSGRVELQLLTCNDAWIGRGRMGDRWVEVGSRGVPPDTVRLEEVTNVSAVPEAHGGIGEAAHRPQHLVPVATPDLKDYRGRLWESVPLMGGPFYVPDAPGLSNWRVGGGSGPEQPYWISATVTNEDNTSLRVTTFLDDSDISEQGMVRLLVSFGERDPMSFPYTAIVTATETAIPTGSSGTVPLRVLKCGQMWTGYGPVGDRWVRVESLGVSLEGLRLDKVADASSVPEDRRG